MKILTSSSTLFDNYMESKKTFLDSFTHTPDKPTKEQICQANRAEAFNQEMYQISQFEYNPIGGITAINAETGQLSYPCTQ